MVIVGGIGALRGHPELVNCLTRMQRRPLIFWSSWNPWHDCFAEVSPPDEVIEDVWIVSEGQIPKLVQAARLAVEDSRDLRMNADALRKIS
jgi:hypothetical protein